MYGTRTKKVTAYGRRNQRYIPVTETRLALRPADPEDTARPVGAIAKTIPTVVSVEPKKVEKTKSAASSPDVFRSRKVIKGSPRISSPKSGVVGVSSGRPPLGVFSQNVPGSPAVPPRRRKRLLSGLSNVTPGVGSKAFSPFVDVDIIVLDDAGRRVSKERRVSKPDVQVNPIGGLAYEDQASRIQPRRRLQVKNALNAQRLMNKDISSPDISDDDDEYVPAHVTSRKKKVDGSVRRVVISSSSEDEDEAINSADPSPPAPRPRKRTTTIVMSSDSEPESAQPLGKRNQGQAAATSSRIQMPTSPKKRSETSDVKDMATTQLTRPSEKPKETKSNPFKYQVEVVVPPSPLHRRQAHQMEAKAPPKETSRPATTWNMQSSSTSAQGLRLPVQSTQHLQLPLVHGKPRQLTPIKPKHTFTFGRRPVVSPPETLHDSDSDADIELLNCGLDSVSLSPVTQRNNDLTFDEEEKTIDKSLNASPSLLPLPPTTCHRDALPVYLQPLLHECRQQTPYNFSDFIETFPHDSIHSTYLTWTVEGCSEGETPCFRKIGEASYSEVYGIGNVVLKVIPLRDEVNGVECAAQEDWPFSSDTKDVVKEIIVTRAMGEICDGFVKLLSAHVVRGRYPPHLLSLWDEYNDRKGSEGVRPDMFTNTQLYAIIVLPNGGPDLEAFSFAKPTSKFAWRQSCSVFWQVARSLTLAEDLVRFEHRDLHWGQILVKHTISVDKTPMKHKAVHIDPLLMDDPAHGVRATIIDLGLARIDRHDSSAPQGNTYWTPFDEVIFEGEGDYQFDVYRMMRDHNGNSWEQYHPMTNVLWLHYLSTKLLLAKRLRAPSTTSGRKSVGAATAAAHALERRSYECLIDIEEALRQAIAAALPVSKKALKSLKARRKTQASVAVQVESAFASAGDVWKFGRTQGWVV